MKFGIDVYFKETLSPDELKASARSLGNWARQELKRGVATPDLPNNAMRDLAAGELPKPMLLAITAHVHQANEAIGQTGGTALDIDFDSLQSDLGDLAACRSIWIEVRVPTAFEGDRCVQRIRRCLDANWIDHIFVRDIAEVPDRGN